MIPTAILALNLALEWLCLWLLLRSQRWTPLTVFIAYQLAFDLLFIPLRAILDPATLSYTYWIGHSVTYLLQMSVFLVWRRRYVFSLFSSVTTALMAGLIGLVWTVARGQQMGLGVICGSMCLFVVIAGVLATPRMHRWPVWAGMGLWAASEVGCSIEMAHYGLSYPLLCATALALIALGSMHGMPETSASETRAMSRDEIAQIQKRHALAVTQAGHAM